MERSLTSANVYVDGFNLYYGCLRGTECQWLDIGALCQKLLPRNPINQIRYFTSRVAARPDAPNRPEQQNAYLRALGTVPRLSIHLGHFQSKGARLPVADPGPGDPRIVKVIKTQEKGSDVNLATFMLLDAFRKESDIAVVISNDSDLREPIRVLIEELGVPVGLVNPHQVKDRCRDLLELKPLFFKQIKPSALRACQFPAVLRDARGEIHRPGGW
jgi:NYN domain